MNSHAREGHYALNVARLPFRHFGIIPMENLNQYLTQLPDFNCLQ